jgi:hypothetical protein
VLFIFTVRNSTDHSFPVHVNRYWNEILLNSFVFDRHIQEVIMYMITMSIARMFIELAQHIVYSNGNGHARLV